MKVTATVDVTPRVAQGKPLTVVIPAGGAAPVAWNLTAPGNIANLRWHVSAKAENGKASRPAHRQPGRRARQCRSRSGRPRSPGSALTP